MRPPSDTVSAFFACITARLWSEAASLIDTADLELWRSRTLTGAYGLLHLGPGSTPATSKDATLLTRLAAQPVPSELGVGNVGEVFELPARVLFERLLAMSCLSETGEVVLPWQARRIAILGERMVSADEAEVRYAHVDQPADLPADMIRQFQRPWAVRLRRTGLHWRLQVPQGLVNPLP